MHMIVILITVGESGQGSNMIFSLKVVKDETLNSGQVFLMPPLFKAGQLIGHLTQRM